MQLQGLRVQGPALRSTSNPPASFSLRYHFHRTSDVDSLFDSVLLDCAGFLFWCRNGDRRGQTGGGGCEPEDASLPVPSRLIPGSSLTLHLFFLILVFGRERIPSFSTGAEFEDARFKFPRAADPAVPIDEGV